MDLLCQGWSIREIAHRLGITYAVARKYRDGAVIAYGLGSTAAAIARHAVHRARAGGIVEAAPAPERPETPRPRVRAVRGRLRAARGQLGWLA